MNDFTDFDSLLKFVEDGVQSGMKKNVPDAIKKKISDTAKNRVILQTSGRAAEGIDDVSQMKDFLKISKGTYDLTVRDMAKPAPSILGQPFDEKKNNAAGGDVFAQWIEYGEWIDLAKMLKYRSRIGWNPGYHETWASYKGTGHDDGLDEREWNYKPRREKRPFMSVVQNDLDNDPSIVTDAILQSIEDLI